LVVGSKAFIKAIMIVLSSSTSTWQLLLLIVLLILCSFHIAGTSMEKKADLKEQNLETTTTSATIEMPKMKILYCTS